MKGLSEYRGRFKKLLEYALPELTPADRAIYSTHSLRRGGVSWAFQQGVVYYHLQWHGSWLTGKSVEGYVEQAVAQLLAITAAM